MKAVVAGEGGVQVVERPVPVPEGRQVLIKVHATALNRADMLQAAGKYPPPPGATDVLGLECAGTVERVGPACQLDQLQVGSRVSALLVGGGYAEFVAVDERQVMVLPDGQTWEEASAVPEVWLTAFQLLHKVAELAPGDVVLVHAGASGVGTAAIQLAKAHGAKQIFVTAGSDDKIALATSLGASAGFNYKTEDWAAQVLERTGGHGADVILDCIGFPYVDSNLRAVAEDGRWVLFGLMGGMASEMAPILGQVLRKRVRLIGSTLRARSIEYKSDLVSRFNAATRELFASGTLRPVLDERSFRGLDAIAAAHAYMATNNSKGKIIVSVL